MRLDNAIHYIEDIRNNADIENQDSRLIKKSGNKRMILIAEEIASLEADIKGIEDIKISASKFPSPLEEEEKGLGDKIILKVDEFNATSIFQYLDILAENDLSDLEHSIFNTINFCNRDDILNNFTTLTEKQSNLLCNIIFSTRLNENLALAASNAMSILVKAKYSFDNKDFKNIKIPYANLSGGIFDKTDFSGSDLSNCNIIRAQFSDIISNGTKIQNLEPNKEQCAKEIKDLSISHDQQYIAATQLKKIHIWNIHFKEKIKELTSESVCLWFTAVSWSYDDAYIVTGDYGGAVFIWESITGNLFAKIQHSKNLIPSISWAPNDYRIALCSYPNVAIRNLDGENILFEDNLGCDTSIIAWSDSGRYLAWYYGNKWINIWDLKDERKYKRNIENIYALEWIKGDDYLVFAGKDCYIYIWNFLSEVITRKLNHKVKHPITVIKWNKRKEFLAVGSFQGLINLLGLHIKQMQRIGFKNFVNFMNCHLAVIQKIYQLFHGQTIS